MKRNFTYGLVLLVIVIAGAYYLRTSNRQQAAPSSTETALQPADEQNAEAKVKDEVLQVLRNIQHDMRAKNYQQLGQYGGERFAAWRDPVKLEEFLTKQLNDNRIGPADYIFRGEPTRYISSGDTVVVVLSEPWHGTTCNVVFARRGDRWLVTDVNNMEGAGRLIRTPAE